jgi:hypothetical protein
MTEQHKCVGRTYNGYRFLMCGVGAKHEHNGKWYCKTHHPPTVEQKRAEKQAQYERKYEAKELARDAEIAERNEMKRRADLYPELLEALKELDSWLVCACIATPEDMAQSFPHMQQVVSAAIAKAEGKS